MMGNVLKTIVGKLHMAGTVTITNSGFVKSQLITTKLWKYTLI